MDAHACPLKFGSCKLFLKVRTVDLLRGLLLHSFIHSIIHPSIHRSVHSEFGFSMHVSLIVAAGCSKKPGESCGVCTPSTLQTGLLVCVPEKVSGGTSHLELSPPGPLPGRASFFPRPRLQVTSSKGPPFNTQFPAPSLLLHGGHCCVNSLLLECSIRTTLSCSAAAHLVHALGSCALTEQKT